MADFPLVLPSQEPADSHAYTIDSQGAVQYPEYRKMRQLVSQPSTLHTKKYEFATTDELDTAHKLQSQLKAMRELAQQGVPLETALSKSYRKAMMRKYRKVETYSKSVLSLLKMQLMSQIAIKASQGENVSNSVLLLSQVVNVLEHMEGTSRHKRNSDLPTYDSDVLESVDAYSRKHNALKKMRRKQGHLEQRQNVQSGKIKRLAAREASTAEQLRQLAEIVSANSTGYDKHAAKINELVNQLRPDSEMPPSTVQVDNPKMQQRIENLRSEHSKLLTQLEVVEKKRKIAEETLKKLKKAVLDKDTHLIRLRSEMLQREKSERDVKKKLDDVLERTQTFIVQQNKNKTV